MPNQEYRSVIVTDVAGPEMEQAHALACALFDTDLVCATPPGHNFIQSFIVFPSGSGEGRTASKQHDASIRLLVKRLRQLALDFVVVHWSDNEDPEIADHHNKAAS